MQYGDTFSNVRARRAVKLESERYLSKSKGNCARANRREPYGSIGRSQSTAVGEVIWGIRTALGLTAGDVE